MFLKKVVCIIVVLSIALFRSHGQDIKIIEKLKKQLASTSNTEEKIDLLGKLSLYLMDINLDQSEEAGKQQITIAEESRNREWMVKAYLSNGLRCSYFAGRNDYNDRSFDYYNKALEIAQKNRLQKWIGIAHMRLANAYLNKSDKDKALNEANEASSLLANIDSDSLRAESNVTLGTVHLARNNKTLALRFFLNALVMAEDIKNMPLIRNCYLRLVEFYNNISDYDRALDYHSKALEALEKIDDDNKMYTKAVYLSGIANLYSQQEKYDIALNYYNQSIKIADSLNFPNLKIPAYVGILNQFLTNNQPSKAMDYFNSPAGETLKNYLSQSGFSAAIDQAYAAIYTRLDKLDSAKIYLDKSAPFFEQSANDFAKISSYGIWADFYKRASDYPNSIKYFLKVKEMSEKAGILENIVEATKQLDTLYEKTGDYRSSKLYSAQYFKYNDSLQKLNKEKEMLQVEAADEQLRLQKKKKQTEEDNQRRHNIQYMAITIGIATLFVLLVFMGLFQVSTGTIRLLGFFTFIMFFEFIILIADHKIHDITHGEPWKVLTIKIILIAMLLPFHHWLEKKTISYLTSMNKLKVNKKGIKNLFSNKKNSGNE
ncbi:MAG: tetratricopeptide repeat protein [Ferruginibacter sp.]|nr:tetratricopeptide repeat protein [Ferruginibacter sp.]